MPKPILLIAVLRKNVMRQRGGVREPDSLRGCFRGKKSILMYLQSTDVQTRMPTTHNGETNSLQQTVLGKLDVHPYAEVESGLLSHITLKNQLKNMSTT